MKILYLLAEAIFKLIMFFGIGYTIGTIISMFIQKKFEKTIEKEKIRRDRNKKYKARMETILKGDYLAKIPGNYKPNSTGDEYDIGISSVFTCDFYFLETGCINLKTIWARNIFQSQFSEPGTRIISVNGAAQCTEFDKDEAAFMEDRIWGLQKLDRWKS